MQLDAHGRVICPHCQVRTKTEVLPNDPLWGSAIRVLFRCPSCGSTEPAVIRSRPAQADEVLVA